MRSCLYCDNDVVMVVVALAEEREQAVLDVGGQMAVFCPLRNLEARDERDQTVGTQFAGDYTYGGVSDRHTYLPCMCVPHSLDNARHSKTNTVCGAYCPISMNRYARITCAQV